MSLKSIVAFVTGTKEDKSILSAAFSFASDFNALVTVLHILPEKSSSHKEQTITRRYCETLVHSCAKEKSIIPYNHIKTHSLSFRPCYRFIKEEGHLSSIASYYSKFADLTLLSHAIIDSNKHYKRETVSSLLEASASILLMPKLEPAVIGYHIAIAWNGSMEVIKAIKQNVAILKLAQKVTFITIGEEDESLPEDDGISLYLSVNAISFSFKRIPKISSKIVLLIEKSCMELEVDLLIVGAYTNSLIRHALLRGVTTHIMEKTRIPVLMSH